MNRIRPGRNRKTSEEKHIQGERAQEKQNNLERDREREIGQFTSKKRQLEFGKE